MRSYLSELMRNGIYIPGYKGNTYSKHTKEFKTLCLIICCTTDNGSIAQKAYELGTKTIRKEVQNEM